MTMQENEAVVVTCIRPCSLQFNVILVSKSFSVCEKLKIRRVFLGPVVQN